MAPKQDQRIRLPRSGRRPTGSPTRVPCEETNAPAVSLRGSPCPWAARASRPPLHFNTKTKTCLANQDYSFNDVVSFADERVFVMTGVRFIALSPRHRFTLVNCFTAGRGPPNGAGLTLGAIYTAERPLTATSRRGEPNWGPLPDVWRIDAAISDRFRPEGSRFSYDLALNVTNVFDRTDLYDLAAWDRATIDPSHVWRAAVGVKF